MADAALSLGWELTPGGDPAYWLGASPKPGNQAQEELVTVPAAAMATHTVIVAQSGSGKSFFLGRLIEEIAVQTQARCLILDPNADFWKVHEVEPQVLWTQARYDADRGLGKLPTERRRSDFAPVWARVSKTIFTARATSRDAPYEQLQVWWPDVSVELFAEDLSPIERSAIYHCHAFLQAIAPLVQLKNRLGRKQFDLIDVAEKLYRPPERGADKEQVKAIVESEFPADRLAPVVLREANQAGHRLISVFPYGGLLKFLDKDAKDALARAFVDQQIKQALVALSYGSPETGKFYFGQAREYQAARILAPKPVPTRPPSRLDVVDLPSLTDRNTRLLATNMLLAQEWKRARSAWLAALERPAEEDTRAPTFIVVDEAHNLVLAEPQSVAERVLREQFRTIAAEGRKYGLFLILVSQRPDKLDPLVVSECENKALMRIDSQSVLGIVSRLFGLEDVPTRLLEKSLEFRMGRVLLLGRWARPGPRMCFSAARRTAEGGRNLRAEHWARAPTVDSGPKGTRPRGGKKPPGSNRK